MNNSKMNASPSVLMVCLGNICRSPLAEAALRQAADKSGLIINVDSAGTGDWHVGSAPDPRACAVALDQGGVDISNLRARQIRKSDFYEFDLILSMDTSNLRHLETLRPEGSSAKLSLLLDYLPGQEGQSVADPYYGTYADFEACWLQVQAATRYFLSILEQ
jgi:protein-tyrosine phosphatase